MQLIKSSVLFLILTSFAFGQQYNLERRHSALDFYKEEITLTVSDSEASVAGIYWFRNTTDFGMPFPVTFPFYVDVAMPFPDMISAYIDDSSKTAISFRESKPTNSIMIRIPMTPKGTTIWHLDYSQKISSTHARYILTSTASWGKPLEEGTYKFIMPASFDSVQVWPDADSVMNSNGQKIYLSHKINFMPKQDMEIFWKAK